MRHLTLAAMLAFGAITALPASAQPETQAFAKAKDEPALIKALGITVRQLEDVDVVDMDGEKIGAIDEILTTPEGEYTALTVELDHSLRLGTREVIVPLEAFSPGGDRLHLDMERKELKALPVWDD